MLTGCTVTFDRGSEIFFYKWFSTHTRVHTLDLVNDAPRVKGIFLAVLFQCVCEHHTFVLLLSSLHKDDLAELH